MAIKHSFRFFRDLLEFLPLHSQAEWEEVSAVSPQKPTVVLVSGFGAGFRTLSIIHRRLKRDGYNVLIITLDWQALSQGIRGLYPVAERLSKLVLEVKKKNGMKKMPIYLVAHSAGGLVARHYVQQLGGSHYCELLITLATPHQGTWTALFGFLSHLILKARCLFQMLPISPFIQQLNSVPFPVGFPLVSISSADDLLCPLEATKLPAEWLTRSEVECIEISRLSHGDFLMSKRIYEVLIDRLRLHHKPSVPQTKPSPRATPTQNT